MGCQFPEYSSVIISEVSLLGKIEDHFINGETKNILLKINTLKQTHILKAEVVCGLFG